MSRGRTNRSRPKGKTGERNAKAFLKAAGWYIASTEIQGLSGDDIFARDPHGKWWSIEVKNTNQCSPKYVAQAKRQAIERYHAIQALFDGASEFEKELNSSLGLGTYSPNNYLLMWHPSNYGVSSEEWVALVGPDAREGRKQASFIAPFKGWKLCE
jgi:Holliday junction resolvase-like predicted endonuclease